MAWQDVRDTIVLLCSFLIVAGVAASLLVRM
jgi:hypothetical protein